MRAAVAPPRARAGRPSPARTAARPSRRTAGSGTTTLALTVIVLAPRPSARRRRGRARRTPVAKGRSEQLGDLGTHLAGVGVDRVAPDEDEIERVLRRASAAAAGRGPSPTCRIRRRPGRRSARRVGAPRDRLAQAVLGRGRPEREDGATCRPVRRSQLDTLADRPAAVRVQLELEPFAHEPAVGAERHRLEPRHLLDAATAISQRGSPSTRSAMMLRWISLVPPGMVAANERRYWMANVPSRHTAGRGGRGRRRRRPAPRRRSSSALLQCLAPEQLEQRVLGRGLALRELGEAAVAERCNACASIVRRRRPGRAAASSKPSRPAAVATRASTTLPRSYA